MKAANCRVTILRGTELTELGDTQDRAVPVRDRVPAAIREQRRQTTTNADDRAQTVLYFTGRMSAREDVRQDDRLRDEATGTIYLVTAVSRHGASSRTNETRLDLERVGLGTI